MNRDPNDYRNSDSTIDRLERIEKILQDHLQLKQKQDEQQPEKKYDIQGRVTAKNVGYNNPFAMDIHNRKNTLPTGSNHDENLSQVGETGIDIKRLVQERMHGGKKGGFKK
jgi:hypothetical protein